MEAEVAFWYSVDASQLSKERLFAYSELLPKFKAQHQIHERITEGLDGEAIHDLYLDAFDDKKLAEHARAVREQDLSRT